MQHFSWERSQRSKAEPEYHLYQVSKWNINYMNVEIDSKTIFFLGWRGRSWCLKLSLHKKLLWFLFHQLFHGLFLKQLHQPLGKPFQYATLGNICYTGKLADPTSQKTLLFNVFQLSFKKFIKPTKIKQPCSLPEKVCSFNGVDLIEHRVIVDG